MSGIIDKRKRSREDDVLSTAPLSKRINNLHLTNFEETQNEITGHTISKAYMDHTSNQTPNRSMAMEQLHLYSPELDEAQNPYYYNKNKFLFELHLERMKRCAV